MSIRDVAVIGAGPAGSAVSYYLNQLSPDLMTTIYESSSYIGGRSTTVDVLGHPVELGASIFVDVNTNLKTAAKVFGLKIDTSDDFLSDEEDSLGIWDGNSFVFQESGKGYWDLAKLFWKYGLAPYRARTHVSTTISKFLKLYDLMPFPSLTDAAAELDLLTYTNSTGWEVFTRSKTSDLFIREVINAATRVNYAQEVDDLHGLMSSVSFVTDGAMSIAGGNWQIFHEMVHRSGPEIKLNTSVTRVTQVSRGWEVCVVDDECETFRHVVIACPLSLSGIQVTPEPQIESVEYVRLHVTLFATPLRPSSKYFKTDKTPPGSILTTISPDVEAPPEFQSLSIVGKRIVAGETILIYKVFSYGRVENETLSRVFGTTQFDAVYLYRHVWNAYPVGEPTSSFDAFELSRGLWYTGLMERFISTMETATVAGRNVAELIHARETTGSRGRVSQQIHQDLK